MKTLLLNPPSFEKFDGGAGARYPARREIYSLWYPVWLAYPAGLIPESRLLDGPAQGLRPEEVIPIVRDYEFLVIFTSSPGLEQDLRLAERAKDEQPDLKIALVGPHVTARPAETLRSSPAVDFVARGEFDYTLAEFAAGKRIEEIAGLSFRRGGAVVHNPDRPLIENLDALPLAVEVFKRDLDFTKYEIPFLLYPYVSFFTSRGCPALCTFCLWPQTITGRRLRTRSSENVAAEARRARELFPQAREIFFDDDTFTWSKARVLDLCRHLSPLKITWSCNARVTTDRETLRSMKETGCRLVVVGFESGDGEILRNIKKGATLDQARAFMKNCRELGIQVHGDFQIGHPGETRETIERTIRFALELDPQTIQVSISHPYPGTEFYRYLEQRGYLTTEAMTDELGHQLPNLRYPHLSGREIVRSVEEFYARYYFRPRIIFRIVRRAFFSGRECRRLYRQAREFFRLRSRRKDFLKAAGVAAIEGPGGGGNPCR